MTSPAKPVRPDPDALVALAAREARGRLKIFLGAAPGVGKTFEMLVQGRRRHLGGTDVVVGFVETHGRAETQAQVIDLEVLRRRRIEYRGQVLDEFDLDAALARRPQVLLLDELAHTNVPGSRHPKRWQDVEELRQAGIEVWSTMNVQHLESLSDVVARITGVRVAETVPDRVLAEADEVELVDIPPADLLERLRQGKIYPGEQASRALKGFFRAGNLAALRELALRRTAERVDADLSFYMRANAIPGPWPVGERVLALVGSDTAAETVVRQARRIADALRAGLVVLHVERPGASRDIDPEAALRLAETLGASVEIVVATDVPNAIIAAARGQNASHIVIGRGRPTWWRRMTGRTLSATLLRRATEFSLHLVPDPTIPPQPVRNRWILPTWATWAVIPGAVAAATVTGAAVDGTVPESALGMVYLAAVVAIAMAAGPLHAAIGAALSFLCWNFLFLSPRYTFTIGGPQDVVGVVVFALVALLLAGTTGGLGRSVQAARSRLFSLRRLIEISRRLGAAATLGDLLVAVAQEAGRVAGRSACVILPLTDGPPGETPEPVVRASFPIDADPDEASMAAARWAMGDGRSTGHGTDTLPTASWQFRPMRTARGVVGLIGLEFRDGVLDQERDRTLTALLDQAAVAIERAHLMEAQARVTARAETEALRTALLTSLGHDLRTPLTVMRGAAEAMRDNGNRLSDATRADLLDTIVEEATRMGHFLSNILDIVRIEAGEITPRREPVDLAEAAEIAIARMERVSGHSIARAISADLPQPRLDPVLLDQILGNLLDNALKYAGPDGAVRVTARRDGPEVAVAVEDDGPGIPGSDLHRIFDPFYRASRTDRIAAGSGLGLAICRGLTVAMGGRITAESPIRHSRGTRVMLRFPA
ncbi:MAG: ATP-binding protein [Acetobacteraceae bacterium]